ncbi:MAG: hypothetical protein O3B13_14535 [Planctomycetota bacterium]|nr:hypothetical protein [Planctomycetota bacterium]
MCQPMIAIGNFHTQDCGDPPIIDTEAAHNYVGYFCNRFGEQWIFQFDRETQTGELRGGDVGWNQSFTVQDGVCVDLLLNQPEALWLAACWSAVSG